MHIGKCDCGCNAHSKVNNQNNQNNNLSAKANSSNSVPLLNRSDNFQPSSKTNPFSQSTQANNSLQQPRAELQNNMKNFVSGFTANFGSLSEKVASFFSEYKKVTPKEEKRELLRDEDEILKIKQTNSSNFNEEGKNKNNGQNKENKENKEEILEV